MGYGLNQFELASSLEFDVSSIEYNIRQINKSWLPKIVREKADYLWEEWIDIPNANPAGSV
ncbi:MAG: hypothetical protein LUQ47_03755 [Methanotrichaceae archaeon]|nr:hypothetical protein [Methanotrichaceae archaeon]